MVTLGPSHSQNILPIMHNTTTHTHSSNNHVTASFFTERVVNMWNCLPGDTVDFSSLSAFKRSIKRVDLSDFLNVT